MSADDDLPHWVPKPGERAVVIGQTGSGKTTLNLLLLQHLPNSPVIIYDSKEEPKFERLPASRLVYDVDDLADAVDDQGVDHIIFRPSVDLLPDWQAMDELLLRHYHDFRGVDCYIDELFTFHSSNGGYGKGLNALYTRGRSRGITTIASTQRPARISKFAMSEAQHVFLFHLNARKERQKVSDETGMEEMDNPPKYHFWHYRTDDPGAPPQLFAPVSLPPEFDTGYTDPLPADAPDNPTTEIGHVWLGGRGFLSFEGWE